jgi:hypothetical protein
MANQKSLVPELESIVLRAFFDAKLERRNSEWDEQSARVSIAMVPNVAMAANGYKWLQSPC